MPIIERMEALEQRIRDEVLEATEEPDSGEYWDLFEDVAACLSAARQAIEEVEAGGPLGL